MTHESSNARRILEDLNPPQKEAVLHEEGPLLVLAGAGSGKTRVITRRIAWLVERGCPPEGVLAITFTNKAAEEMKVRAEGLTGLKSPWISTFHSFCARLLRRHARHLPPYDNAFTIYDSEDSRGVIKEILDILRIDPQVWSPKAAQERISWIKNTDSAEAEYRRDFSRGRQLQEVHEAYAARMREQNCLDFDDLLILTARLFREAPDVLERYRAQFRHVLIDEYQDINALQYEIGRQLTSEHRNICITGDPDQSIYAWRGADVTNMLNFQRDYPDARVVTLDRNYRSTMNILEVANHLIENNEERLPKVLWTDRGAGEPVKVHRFVDEREEAREVASLIRDFVRDGRTLGDIAVFYRIGSLSRAIEQELVLSNLPYSIVGGVEFYLRKEVKDVLAYLRILDNPRDALAVRRVLNVPPRGLGEATLRKLLLRAEAAAKPLLEVVLAGPEPLGLRKAPAEGLLDFARVHRRLLEARSGPVADLVERAIRATGYDKYLETEESSDVARERLANVWALKDAAKDFDDRHPQEGLTAFLELVNLLGDVDRWDRSADRLSMMTLHAAKGLEFPVVVIVGVEDGILPLRFRSEEDVDLEEERRLLYVGITRAQTHLYLTHVASRMRFGRTIRAVPSQFLPELVGPRAGASLDIDPDTRESLRFEDRSEESWDAEDFDVEEDLYPVGTRVYHDEYGEGLVTRISGIGRRRRITVEFEEWGEKQFVPGFTPLRRLR